MIEIIAEIANAHQGSEKNAEKLAIKCLEVGADAVKFQIYFAEEMLVKSHPRYQHFKNQSFSEEVWKKLIKKVRKKGKVYCDVFGVKAFKIAKKLKVDGYKIHSSDLINHFLLKKISKENKKIFFSTGGSKISEIQYALKYFKKLKIKPTLLHGFQSYPTKIEDSKLLRINFLKKNFGHIANIGYQDHTDGDNPFNVYLPLIALGMGINTIEKHVTLNRSKKGTDYYSSIEPKNLKKFINIIRKSEIALNKNFNSFSSSENKYRIDVKKHWVAKKEYQLKDKLDDNIEMKRTNKVKTEPFFFEEINRAEVLKNIKKDNILNYSNLKKKVIGIIVARSDSKRLKKKALLKINGRTTIDHLIKRIKLSKKIDDIILCTTKNKIDNRLVKIAKKNNIKFFRGASNDVLKRIIMCLKKIKNVGTVIRITGDDILVDPSYIDKSIFTHLKINADYTSSKNLPSGTEVEVFSYKTLKLIYNFAEDTSGSEYLTNYIKDNKDFFKIANTNIKKTHRLKYRLTIDSHEDFFIVKKLLEYMKKINKEYSYTIEDIKNFFKKFPKISKINKNIIQRKMPLKFNSNIKWSET